MQVITDVFEAVGNAVSGFIDVIANGLSKVTAIFYTPGVGEASGSFTFLGVMLLIGLGAGLCWALIRLIRALVAGSTKSA